MTLVVGILCTDGVVIGTDSAATMGDNGRYTIEQPHREKVQVIGKQVIVAGTGQVGLGQRFEQCVRGCWDLKEGFAGRNVIDIGCRLSQGAIRDFQGTGLSAFDYGALVAFPHEQKPSLVEFASGSFQPEVMTNKSWYVSMGAGKPVADPLLGFVREVFWGDSLPDLRAGIFAATMVLTLGCEMAPYGVSKPVQMAVLIKNRKKNFFSKTMSLDELQEQIERVDDVKTHLKEYTNNLLSQDKMSGNLPRGPG